MSLTFNIDARALRAEVRDLERTLTRLARDQVPLAVRSAQNRTAAQARTQVSRTVRQMVPGLKAKALAKRLRVFRATRARDYAALWAGLKLAFRPKAEAPGATTDFVVFRGAVIARPTGKEFKARNPRGRVGIFERDPTRSRRYRIRGQRRRADGQSTELPILEVLQDYRDDMQDAMQQVYSLFIRNKYVELLRRDLDFRIKRARGLIPPRRR